ncbi:MULTISPECIES: hypothetical protein [Billgrantia]|uniref:Uncharacterized protein n=2 Tax=Billgrantia TaxID=3137761 RepID=A0ABS9A729_9GAMM|nr:MULTISPECIES: hypothetical protein [Halomonas]MCE8004591.1 hypothetical protein [Halomonas ethanolica]MCE8030427.1 hypothetical protein [Halomonas desiderata]MCE8044096.1 hypothetical protein [Halomonas desiderata]MCE8048670.1 hypothetical protein [Halomonas desiderata]OUE40547.1 hypothetical protein BZY95_13920 [Halomonas desiderata SP1]
MKHWRLVLRVASDSMVLQDAGELRRNASAFLRVNKTYEVACLGINMFGIDFLAEDDEFNHIMCLVKILETRYRLSIMQFSELDVTDEPGVTVKVGSQPATCVA